MSFAPHHVPPILLLACLSATAQADEAAVPASPLDRVSVWVGGFQADTDTTIYARAGNDEISAAGTVNLEDDLGMDPSQPVVHVRMDFLGRGTHGLSLEYFGFKQANRLALARDIEFDGELYQANAEVSGEFDYDFGSAAYRWWFGEGATVYGLGLGLAYYRVQTELAGEASWNDDSVSARAGTSDSAVAPLLELGWRHAFNDHVRIYADLSGVAKGGRPLSGHIVNAAVGLEWFPTRRIGLAAEYGATTIRLDRRRDFLDARLDLDLQGPSIFLRLR